MYNNFQPPSGPPGVFCSGGSSASGSLGVTKPSSHSPNTSADADDGWDDYMVDKRRHEARKACELAGVVWSDKSEIDEDHAQPPDESSDQEEVLDVDAKHGCAIALRDIILYDRLVPENLTDDVGRTQDDVQEELLSTRPSWQWIEILEAAIKEVAAESQGGAEECKHIEKLCFSEFGSGAGLGTASRAKLRLMRGMVTLWEALCKLSQEWSSIVQAIETVAQQQLFSLASGAAFGGIHSSTGRCGLVGLQRAGARLLRTDARGRVAAHLAAKTEAVSDFLIELVLEAPMALLVEDEEGQTPLDVLSESPLLECDKVVDALAGAALQCLAWLPHATARVLRRSPSASATWDILSQRSGCHGLLLAAWEEGVEGKLDELIKDAQDMEAGAVERWHHEVQRVKLLRSLANDHVKELDALSYEELQLRLTRAEEMLKKRDEAEKQMKASLEREVKRLQSQVVEYEEELTSLRRMAAAGSWREVDPSDSGRQTLNGVTSASESDINATPKSKARTAKQKAKAASRKTSDSRPSEVAVLEDIRSARMVGSDPAQLPLELRGCIAEMRESLTAAVDRLARDLYESEAHFLQELLQNADDNKYDPDVVPSLRFVLRRSHRDDASILTQPRSSSRSYFFAANNEVGLTEADVRSICDISRSSKAQSDTSTTGHKGVGWKSVFRVCDTPHVLSKGWRFRFSTAGLGMLTPEVIDDSEYSALPDEVREAHSSGLTVFYLPLTSDKVAQSIELELEVIESDAAQLLFLRRIREISLSGFSDHFSKLSVIDDKGIRATTRCVRSKLKDSSDSGCMPVPGDTEDCIETHFQVCTHDDVTVALPLVDEPPAQRIFAFLPVRSVGFRFAVHAPFHLTASRTDLHRSVDNARRRNGVAPAFLKACQANEEVASKALRFLGTEPAEPFWLSAHANILAGLQGVACVMTENGMVDPRSCLMRGDVPAAQWVPESLLSEACGLAFASPGNPLVVMRDLGVATFGFEHLVKCILHNDGEWLKDLWRDSRRSSIFSDIYASLNDGLVDNLDRLDVVRTLRIFPLIPDGVGSRDSLSATLLNQVVLSDSVELFSSFTDNVPRSWQVLLVRCMGDLEVLAHGRKLLQVLNITRVDEITLEKLALRHLVKLGSQPSASRSTQDAHTAWAALAVLQRCHKLGRAPPKPWEELRDTIALPSASGELLAPALLQPWSFMGVEERLPKHVVQSIHEFAGVRLFRSSKREKPTSKNKIRMVCSAMPPRERVAAPSWDRPSGSVIRWHLEWEMFLCALGCSPLDPTGSVECSVEATLKLGSVLVSGELWQNAAKSAKTLNYLQQAVGKGATQTRRQWLRQLPVVLEDGSIAALEDYFLHETFHSLGGAHLPYVVDAPPVTHEFLSRLGVSITPDGPALLKCLRWLRAHDVSDTGLMADLYGRLWQLSNIQLDQEPLVYVPGRGWLQPGYCCWNSLGNDLLQRCCRLSSLSEHYERFGDATSKALQAIVLSSPKNDIHELVSVLMNAINVVKANMQAYTGGNPPPSQEEASSKLFDAAQYAISAIAKICAYEDNVFAESGHWQRAEATSSDIARSSFRDSRLIVVPDASCPRILWLDEAFWSVAPELRQQPYAAFALELHYGGNDLLRNFFLNVLQCRAELTQEDMMQMYRHGSRAAQGSTRVIEGLSIFPSQSSSSSCHHPGLLHHRSMSMPHGVDAAMHMARNAQQLMPGMDGIANIPQRRASTGYGWPVPTTSGAPRLWKQIGEFDGFTVFSAGGARIPQDWIRPDTALLKRICMIFKLQPGQQVGLAYDPSGRCVCEERLYLDLSLSSRFARLGNTSPPSAAIFWTTELTHAIAHLTTGSGHGPALSHLQSELLAVFLPLVLASEAFGGPPMGYNQPFAPPGWL